MRDEKIPTIILRYRNAVDGGFVIPYETANTINTEINTNDEIEIDVEKGILKNLTKSKEYNLKNLGDIKDKKEAGGIFNYARNNNMIK